MFHTERRWCRRGRTSKNKKRKEAEAEAAATTTYAPRLTTSAPPFAQQQQQSEEVSWTTPTTSLLSQAQTTLPSPLTDRSYNSSSASTPLSCIRVYGYDGAACESNIEAAFVRSNNAAEPEDHLINERFVGNQTRTSPKGNDERDERDQVTSSDRADSNRRRLFANYRRRRQRPTPEPADAASSMHRPPVSEISFTTSTDSGSCFSGDSSTVQSGGGTTSSATTSSSIQNSLTQEDDSIVSDCTIPESIDDQFRHVEEEPEEQIIKQSSLSNLLHSIEDCYGADDELTRRARLLTLNNSSNDERSLLGLLGKDDGDDTSGDDPHRSKASVMRSVDLWGVDDSSGYMAPDERSGS